MRGNEQGQPGVLGYLSREKRVPDDHPLRPIRAMVEQALPEISPRFEAL